MPGAGTVAELLVETALTFVPELLDIPVLGRVLIGLGFGKAGVTDTQALEQLQAQAKQIREKTDERIKRNARYVLKASDAMTCVQNNLIDGKILLSLGKGIVNTVIGKTDQNAADLLMGKIFTCIEEHELRQNTPRVIGSPKSKYVRPRKGHGKGRSSFG